MGGKLWVSICGWVSPSSPSLCPQHPSHAVRSINAEKCPQREGPSSIRGTQQTLESESLGQDNGSASTHCLILVKQLFYALLLLSVRWVCVPTYSVEMKWHKVGKSFNIVLNTFSVFCPSPNISNAVSGSSEGEELISNKDWDLWNPQWAVMRIQSTERLRRISKVTQLINGSAGIRGQTVWLQSLCL